MSRTILVVGGTGRLGRPVALSLHQAGFRVRVASRDPERQSGRFPQGVELVRAELSDENSLKRALEGVQGVHLNLNGGPTAADYERIEVRGTATLCRLAKTAGAERLTMISGLNADPNSPVPFVRCKGRAEDFVRSSGLDYLIFRPTWFMESLPLFVRGQAATLIGTQPHPLRWVAAADFAGLVVKAHESPNLGGRTMDVLGPEPLTFGQALERYARSQIPPLGVRVIGLFLGRILAAVSFSAELRDAVGHMEFFNRTREIGDGKEAAELLGRPMTTLSRWLREFSSARA